MTDLVAMIFVADVLILFVLLSGVSWSIVLPEKRIWPPPGKHSLQYWLAWVCFYSVFTLNAAIIILDWNSWIFKSNLRLIIGIPLALIGGLLVSWGINTLGTKNTSGLEGGFVSTGPYRFTRNPQYLGDMILFLGLSLISNSLFLWITHILLILVFVLTPLAEETWLEDLYGEEYTEYKKGTPRFL